MDQNTVDALGLQGLGSIRETESEADVTEAWSDAARKAAAEARRASAAAHKSTLSGAGATQEKLDKLNAEGNPGYIDVSGWSKSARGSSGRGSFQSAAARHNHLVWMHTQAGEHDKAALHQAAAAANMKAAEASGRTGQKYN